jgi:hypothetical protein
MIEEGVQTMASSFEFRREGLGEIGRHDSGGG